MNTILTFLHENRPRLKLEQYNIPQQLTSVVITPRFRASSHVVFLIMPQQTPEPVLVAKVPRLPGASATVAREVANLQVVQASRPGGFDSIPRVIAFEPYKGHHLLVETALVGQLMSPEVVRQKMSRCCEVTVDWLMEVQRPIVQRGSVLSDSDWYSRLVERPLAHLETALPLTKWEQHLLNETRRLVAPLRQANLPLVFEHGDLSHPNLFLLKDGRLGVVDWELAEPQGLVAYDLFFFLTYIAFARSRASTSADYLAAFQETFFGPGAWATPYVEIYARQFQLTPALLTSLFVLSWARYLASLLLRLEDNKPTHEQLDSQTASWLRQNRYYALWQYAINHADQLAWGKLLTE